MKYLLIFITLSIILFPSFVSAYNIVSKDTCDLFNCCSIVNIANYTTQELNQLKNTALNDLNVKRGKIDFSGITIFNSSSVQICGKIEGASSNYWGIGTIWNSTWWNSSFPYRYQIYTARVTNQLFSVNDSDKVFGQDIIWTNTTNNTAYIYCQNQNCLNGVPVIANLTDRIPYFNETNQTGYLPTSVYDPYYKMVLNLDNTTAVDSTINKRAVQTQLVYQTDNNLTGKFGRGLTMNSTTGSYRLNTSEVNGGNIFTAYTFEMWVRFDRTNITQYLARGKTKDGSFGIDIQETSAGKLSCQHMNSAGSWYFATSTTSPAINTWYYLVCVWNGTHINLYLNGNFEKATAVNSARNIETGGTTWASGTSSSPLLGVIDEIRVSNITRSDQYISDQYSNGINLYTSFGSEEGLTIPTLHASLNGTEGNYTANCSEAVNYTVWFTTNNGKDFSSPVAYYHNTSSPVSNTSPPYQAITSYSSNTTGFNFTAFYGGNDSYSPQTVTIFLDVVNCSAIPTPPVVYNYTDVESKFCNGTILTTWNKYNSDLNIYYNYSVNCTYGCDSKLEICKPNNTYTFLIVVAILFVTLFISTYIKKNWS